MASYMHRLMKGTQSLSFMFSDAVGGVQQEKKGHLRGIFVISHCDVNSARGTGRFQCLREACDGRISRTWRGFASLACYILVCIGVYILVRIPAYFFDVIKKSVRNQI